MEREAVEEFTLDSAGKGKRGRAWSVEPCDKSSKRWSPNSQISGLQKHTASHLNPSAELALPLSRPLERASMKSIGRSQSRICHQGSFPHPSPQVSSNIPPISAQLSQTSGIQLIHQDAPSGPMWPSSGSLDFFPLPKLQESKTIFRNIQPLVRSDASKFQFQSTVSSSFVAGPSISWATNSAAAERREFVAPAGSCLPKRHSEIYTERIINKNEFSPVEQIRHLLHRQPLLSAEIDKQQEIRMKQLEEEVRVLRSEVNMYRTKFRAMDQLFTFLRERVESGRAVLEGCGDSDVDDAYSSCPDDQQVAHGPSFKENDDLDARHFCRVCLCRIATTLLLPCRHLCICKECERKTELCPMCGIEKHASLHVQTLW
eukprot:TRINITY_DN5942_c0_g1_i2.p1 TRINITY_DN5942_c0_g1~~TRINITY_DN5942_c0_g1_i2.p1  ORF type:complete len:373 (+),score=10.31 TRINITY_DN5942_c0_g1_i2:277-1395(+)